VFARSVRPAPDVDEDLYGGFVSDKDRRRLLEFRALNVAQLKSMGDARPTFDDPRLDVMVFRYCARNFPGTLTAQEALTWQAHLQASCSESAAPGWHERVSSNSK
jgi:exodeoxyribonuclease-1